MSEWHEKKFTALAKFVNGYAFGPGDWGKEGLPIVRIEQLKDPTTIDDFFDGKLPELKIFMMAI
jgi:type I restriction enzyme S subunit